MEYAEKLIVRQLKEGNTAAYKYLYDKHYEAMCKVAEYYVHDSFVAESLAEDVIFHLWEIRETVEISTTLRGYLVRAVRNASINYLNSEHERREVALSNFQPDDIERSVLSDDYPLGDLLEKELEDVLHESIEDLPDECRMVFKKSRFEGKKYEEIAAELGISVNTVKYHIKNALSKLQNALQKYWLLFVCFLKIF